MNKYREHWDYYAKKTPQRGDWWPGDEWGTQQSWERVFQELFLKNGAQEWRTSVEIGAGGGKYTEKLLQANSRIEILAADVSPAYQKVCIKRLTQAGLMDRVQALILDNDSSTLRKEITSRGWEENLDALYSIDAMVHVDLQHLMVYLVTAALTLRIGGKLIMTLANTCSDGGFNKLISDTKSEYARQGKHTAKFEWTSPDMAASILQRLGFEVSLQNTRGGHSLWVVGTLQERPSDPAISACID